MDFFDSHYYKTNKILLTAIGRWPYSPKIWNVPVTFLCVFIFGTQLIAKICGSAMIYHDAHLFFDSLPPIMIDLLGVVQMGVHISNIDKFRMLLDHMKEDWKTLTTDEDRKIMCEYAERGRKSARLLMVFIYCVSAFFMIMPFAPQILHLANSTGKRTLPHNVEYFVDMEKIYYSALVHGYLTIIIIITILIAADALYIVFIHHACGMLAIIGYRLEHLMDDKRRPTNLSSLTENDKPYHNVCECIERHIRVLRFASVLESSYSTCFFLNAGINVMMLSVAGVHAIIHLDNPQNLIRQMGLTYGQVIHLFFEAHQAQRLINHSSRINGNIMNSSWYLTSIKTRKLLSFMIMRAHVPCVLTGGKMFVMSMQAFGAIIRSSVSYFTLLRSMQ